MKKLFKAGTIITAAIIAGALAGCGDSGSAATTAAPAAETAPAQTEAPSEAAEETEAAEAAADTADTGEPVHVKLGVCGTMTEEIWDSAIDTLADEGIDLEIIEFSDYSMPNNALASGEIDINQFQHQAFFNDEIKTHGYELSPVGHSYIIPLNLYSLKVSDPSELKDGDTVAIPNDVTNGGRALKVLEAAGLIKLKDDIPLSPTVDDIEEYLVDITIEELQGSVIPAALQDIDAAVINGNYVVDFGMSTDDAIFKDTSLTDENYWGLIVVRTEDTKDPAKLDIFEKIVEAYQSQGTIDIYNDRFGGYHVPVGWDRDLISQYR